MIPALHSQCYPDGALLIKNTFLHFVTSDPVAKRSQSAPARLSEKIPAKPAPKKRKPAKAKTDDEIIEEFRTMALCEKWQLITEKVLEKLVEESRSMLKAYREKHLVVLPDGCRYDMVAMTGFNRFGLGEVDPWLTSARVEQRCRMVRVLRQIMDFRFIRMASLLVINPKHRGVVLVLFEPEMTIAMLRRNGQIVCRAPDGANICLLRTRDGTEIVGDTVTAVGLNPGDAIYAFVR